MKLASVLLLAVTCNRTPDEPVRPLSVNSDPTDQTTRALSAVTASDSAVPIASAPPSNMTCPVDPLGGPPKADVVSLTFGNAKLETEIARRPDETERGLMYRTSMPENHGMIFLMGSREEHTFWMHNTCIPLDMLFVDDDGTIVGILENVPILNDKPRSVGAPSSYVVETNAGWCRKKGVKKGQKLVLPKF